jgi:two-component system chemotaxis sensor kinase CheA
LVFEEMTVRLVDLHELARKVHPDWYSALPQSDASGDGGPRVLVVEDSEFFRKQLVNFLGAEGYQTCESEDGAAAWHVLQDADQHFDLVVTDIEMPRMDGFELARHIRGDRHLAGLPIVAVTSLAGEDDERRGRDIGIDEYHVKLDRESLLNSVARLLRTSAHTALARSSS